MLNRPAAVLVLLVHGRNEGDEVGRVREGLCEVPRCGRRGRRAPPGDIGPGKEKPGANYEAERGSTVKQSSSSNLWALGADHTFGEVSIFLRKTVSSQCARAKRFRLDCEITPDSG